MTIKKIVDNTPGAGVSHRQCEGAFSFPDQEEETNPVNMFRWATVLTVVLVAFGWVVWKVVFT